MLFKLLPASLLLGAAFCAPAPDASSKDVLQRNSKKCDFVAKRTRGFSTKKVAFGWEMFENESQLYAAESGCPVNGTDCNNGQEWTFTYDNLGLPFVYRALNEKNTACLRGCEGTYGDQHIKGQPFSYKNDFEVYCGCSITFDC